MKKLIVFDLDGTLAESKSPLDAEMSNLLHELLSVAKVAVISGGDWPQFEKQVLSHLPQEKRLKDLSLLPTCGTKFFQYGSAWKKLYSEDFTPEEKSKIVAALSRAVEDACFKDEKPWGETIEDRGSQITYSALGQHAPLNEKTKWDPDYAKRKKIKALLDTQLPEFSVRMGGATSIDVTKPGIDKGYGVRKLRDILGISLKEMIVVGDAMFAGGNDYPAEQAGVIAIPVRGPEDTKRVIQAIIACLEVDLPPNSFVGEHALHVGLNHERVPGPQAASFGHDHGAPAWQSSGGRRCTESRCRSRPRRSSLPRTTSQRVGDFSELKAVLFSSLAKPLLRCCMGWLCCASCWAKMISS
jgi:HAD superfamily hydrolase (TIGR01484 family)